MTKKHWGSVIMVLLILGALDILVRIIYMLIGIGFWVATW